MLFTMSKNFKNLRTLYIYIYIHTVYNKTCVQVVYEIWILNIFTFYI